MMGGFSRGDDPRIQAAGQLIMLLSEPEGVQKAVTSLRAVHQEILTEAKALEERFNARATELEERESAIRDHEAGISDRLTAIAAKEKRLETAGADLARREDQARLTLDHAKAIEAKTNQRAIDLQQHDIALNNRHEERSRQLNTEIANQNAALGLREGSLDERSHKLDDREREVLRGEAGLRQRLLAVVKREEVAKAATDAADTKAKELDQVSAALVSVISAKR